MTEREKETAWDMLARVVRRALADLADCDRTLLHIEANERCITHKLAEYVRDQFESETGQERRPNPTLSVDCEYNRFGPLGEPKRLPWRREALNERGEVYYTPSPDICLHHRTDETDNRLIMELKTYFNATEDAALLDKMKLVAYLEGPLLYEFGLYLNLGVSDRGIQLIEARLASRAAVRSVGEEQRHELWVEGQRILTEETKNGRGCRLKRTNVDRDEAGGLIARFDQIYALQDVRDCLISDHVSL